MRTSCDPTDFRLGVQQGGKICEIGLKFGDARVERSSTIGDLAALVLRFDGLILDTEEAEYDADRWGPSCNPSDTGNNCFVLARAPGF